MNASKPAMIVALSAVVSILGCNPASQVAKSQEPEKPEFNGVIKTDIRDSKPDWAPFTPAKAPDGAPNILFVLYDDTGLAAWSPYGGRINMPTLDKISEQGS
jgi:hypothetical protein